MTLIYGLPITPEPDGSAYNVAVPALPGCFTFGETIEEAITMSKDAIGLYLEDLISCGEPIPEEKERPQGIVVSVAA